MSVSSQVGFQSAFNWFNGISGQVILFLLLWVLLHHLFSGVRFLLIDIDQGVDKQSARLSAWLVLLLAPCSSLLLMWLL
ncbi:MAG: succinate dehydrogenase, cytochrome b556 subunit [gamma proteobacterium symbiont of Bathyaustriella thionipta]|nr:succinate dehydrogenase, cytochrome b556 subunit [gamma proteobacterium symbiont of Bathyaustriella thionipta]